MSTEERCRRSSEDRLASVSQLFGKHAVRLSMPGMEPMQRITVDFEDGSTVQVFGYNPTGAWRKLREVAVLQRGCAPVAVDEDGWSEWLHPTAPSFFSKCCDCGLIHEMEFQIVPFSDNAALNPGEGANGVIIFRVRRVGEEAA
jgi:hypothetical protein